jgi:hypothetical protein
MPCACLLNEGLGLGGRNMGKLHVLINVQSNKVAQIDTAILVAHYCCACQQLNCKAVNQFHHGLQKYVRRYLLRTDIMADKATRLGHMHMHLHTCTIDTKVSYAPNHTI